MLQTIESGENDVEEASRSNHSDWGSIQSRPLPAISPVYTSKLLKLGVSRLFWLSLPVTTTNNLWAEEDHSRFVQFKEMAKGRCSWYLLTILCVRIYRRQNQNCSPTCMVSRWVVAVEIVNTSKEKSCSQWQWSAPKLTQGLWTLQILNCNELRHKTIWSNLLVSPTLSWK